MDKSQINEEIEEWQNHLRGKDQVRLIKEMCKLRARKDHHVLAAAFDLQKVLLCPYGQTTSFYYSQNLANHNFTVTGLDSMNTHCYFWDESECQKGSCEIATSLHRFFKKRALDGISDFYLFSDRCRGRIIAWYL